MDDFGLQERIRRDIERREIARRLLGVGEGASVHELKSAWRRACKENHPDRNAEDPDAGRRFAAINCAYRLLAHGEPSELLVGPGPTPDATADEGKYRLDNSWGLFLWWRDRFFSDMWDPPRS
jgi:hypothetical protein